jgi:NADPH:quinone reductase-like Zn-dependent oxidoreductase
VVEAVGNKVSEFNVGDEVYYAVVASQPGTYTEYIAVESKQVSLKPNNLNFVEAASIPYVALTTWAALVTKAKLDPCKAMGKKILVHGGSGGVGSFAIQLLKSWGCFVATTCSTKNYDFVKSLGADIVIDYTKETFNQKISDFDIVFDTVGSKTQGMEEKSISILKKNKSSCYVTIVHPIMRNFDQYGLIVGMIVNVFQGFKKSIRYRKIRYKWALYKPNSAAFKTVTPLIQQEKIKPVIDRLFRLEEVAEAHAYMSHQRLRGKVILTINET